MLVFPNGFKTKTAIQLGKAAIHDALLLTLEMNRDELEQSNLFWHTTPKIERLPKETVYGFVSNSTLKFRFFSSMRIAPYLNDLGLLPLSAKGKPIVRLKQGKKSFVELVQEMRPDQQKRLLREILRDQDIFKTKLWTQNHCMDWREIEKLGSGSDFSKHFNTLFAKEAKKSTGKGDKVNLAVVWMAVYFLCHQKIRWVSNQSCLQTDSLLNAFAPFNGAVFFSTLPERQTSICV